MRIVVESQAGRCEPVVNPESPVSFPYWLLLVPVAYVIGMFPSAAYVARAKGHNIYKEGSGNPGTSNVARVVGKKYAAVVFVLDLGKGAIVTAAGWYFFGLPAAWAFAAAALIGHMFPAINHFKGGKGVATGSGAMLVLFPIVWVICATTWLVTAKLTKKAALGSLIIAIACPFLALVIPWPRRATWPEFAVLCALSVLVILRHANNLRRLVKGEELGLGSADPSAG